jgi:sigma-B regulation protein RsbU (phosphoserine phosphatase)
MTSYVLSGNHGTTPLRFPLRQGTQVVGRTRESDITIVDAAISRRHAEVSLDGERVVLKDLGSLNGTLVNGAPLTGEIVLKPGDQVRFGQVTLVLGGGDDRPLSPNFGEERTGATLTTTFAEIRNRAERSRSDRILAALAEAGQVLSRRMEPEEVYGKVLDLLERVLDASRILVLEPEPGGSHRVAASRVKNRDTDEPLKMSRTMLRDILVDGRSFLTTDASRDAQWNARESIVGLGVQSAMGAPLFDDDRILGAIYVDSFSAVGTYSAEDLSMLTLLAHMTAVKVTNSRLEKEEEALAELRQELTLATRIQTNLLPKEIPPLDGYAVFAHQSPCQAVGGDLYDVRPGPDGKMWLVLGDVTGHGIGAALLMSSAMAGVSILAGQCSEPGELVRRLQAHMERTVEMGQYLTLFVGLLDPAAGRLEYVNAGHVPPILIGPAGRRTLDGTGFPVALLPGGTGQKTAECVLEPGSTLLVFSDGVSEFARDNVQYDEGRFDALLDRLGPAAAETLGNALLADVEDFGGGQAAEDDLTLLIVHRRPAP